MEKEKMIEDLVKALDKIACLGWIDDIKVEELAEKLVDLKICKIPEGAVVLTREEYEELKQRPEKVHDEMDERMKEELAIEKRMGEKKAEQARNGTKMEVLKKLNGFRFVMYDEFDDGHEVASWTCDEDNVKRFAKEIGAEVE